MFTDTDIALKVIFSAITIIGVTGNVMVCAVVLLVNSMRTPMNVILVSLAISDLFLLVFFSPTFIFRGLFTHPTGTTGDVLCAVLTGETLAWMGGYASSVFLLAISVERYFAVADPHSYGASFVTRNLKLVNGACWLFSIIWNCIPGFLYKRYDPTLQFCNMVWSPSVFKTYSMLCFFVLGVIPLAIMTVLYSRVIYILWFKQVVVQIGDQERQRIKRKRATRMVLIVTFIYACCWFPEITIFVIFAYAPGSIRGEIAYPATVALVSLNSMINPIIYSLHSNHFRVHLKRLACCRL
ncbi:predicted protein, partial [Nematostella vectensis]